MSYRETVLRILFELFYSYFAHVSMYIHTSTSESPSHPASSPDANRDSYSVSLLSVSSSTVSADDCGFNDYSSPYVLRWIPLSYSRDSFSRRRTCYETTSFWADLQDPSVDVSWFCVFTYCRINHRDNRHWLLTYDLISLLESWRPNLSALSLSRVLWPSSVADSCHFTRVSLILLHLARLDRERRRDIMWRFTLDVSWAEKYRFVVSVLLAGITSLDTVSRIIPDLQLLTSLSFSIISSDQSSTSNVS